MPIYLNWVVKLLADLEMYIGAVERISHYINPNDKTASDNDTDENPCELMAITPKERCEYIDIICGSTIIFGLRRPKPYLFIFGYPDWRNKIHSLIVYNKLAQIIANVEFLCLSLSK